MYHDQERGMVEGRGGKEIGRGGRGGRGGDVPIHKTGVENSNLTSNDKPVCQPVSISLLPPSPLPPPLQPFLPSGQPPVQQGRTR